MLPPNDYLLYYIWLVRDMIRGPKYFDDGDYGIDEWDEWIDVGADPPEHDEGTKIGVDDMDYYWGDGGADSDDDDDDDDDGGGYWEEDEDVMGVLYG